jgi:hypothetical protein
VNQPVRFAEFCRNYCRVQPRQLRRGDDQQHRKERKIDDVDDTSEKNVPP